MRLPAMPVRSGRDATLNFDKLRGVMGFDILRAGTGKVKVKEKNKGPATFVNHGLGKIPVAVFLTLGNPGSVATVHWQGVTGTVFEVVAFTEVAFEAELTFSWLAIG